MGDDVGWLASLAWSLRGIAERERNSVLWRCDARILRLTQEVAVTRRLSFGAPMTIRSYVAERRLFADFVEKPGLLAAATGSARASSEAKLGRSASRGEDRRRKRDEFRQFPQILGGGR